MVEFSYTDFLNTDLGRWLDERLKANQADVVHDLLAYLAEQMIAMNKEKQREVKGFLTWLEREIGAKVDDLTNKTKLQSYHDHDLETVIATLRQNRRRLRANPDARAFQEALQREFAASVAKLTPLKQKIALTDGLIDQIVYRLYGLTPDEVATVEKAAARAPVTETLNPFTIP